jgi:hypothetical protein
MSRDHPPTEELTAEGRADALEALRSCRQMEAQLTERVRTKVMHVDAFGMEKADWFILVGIAAESEMLRRVHEKISDLNKQLDIREAIH